MHASLEPRGGSASGNSGSIADEIDSLESKALQVLVLESVVSEMRAILWTDFREQFGELLDPERSRRGE